MNITLEERVAIVETEVRHTNETLGDVKTVQSDIVKKIDGIATALSEQKGARQLKKEQWAIMTVLSSLISAITAVIMK